MNQGKICTLIAVLFCWACNKTATTPRPQPEQTVAVASSRSFTRDMGSTVLTVKLTPYLLCFSYPNGATPRPCTITVQVTCELSNPIQGSIKAELLKADENGYGEGTKHAGIERNPLTMVLNIPANSSKINFATTFDCPDNNTVPDIYSLGAVSVFRRIN